MLYIFVLIFGTVAYLLLFLYATPVTVAAGAILFLFLVWFSLSIFVVQVPFFCRTKTKGDSRRFEVALTFDDGPHQKYTSRILDILKEEDVKVTFFLVGEKAEKNIAIVRRIVKEGHQIGNHSMSHKHLLSLQREKSQIKEMEECQSAIFDTTGISPSCYRPPMGYKTPSTHMAAKRLGLTIVGWDIKGWDVFQADPEKIASSILNRVGRGSIILLHDSSSVKGKSTDRTPTIDALSTIISGLKERGLKPVTLEELFASDTGAEK